MNEDQLRSLIRDAVARHLGGRSDAAHAAATPGAVAPVSVQHVSHALYLALPGGGDGCLIEPAVPCNHCGFCQSHGH